MGQKKLFCDRCGQKNSVDAKVCKMCGNSFAFTEESREEIFFTVPQRSRFLKFLSPVLFLVVLLSTLGAILLFVDDLGSGTVKNVRSWLLGEETSLSGWAPVTQVSTPLTVVLPEETETVQSSSLFGALANGSMVRGKFDLSDREYVQMNVGEPVFEVSGAPEVDAERAAAYIVEGRKVEGINERVETAKITIAGLPAATFSIFPRGNIPPRLYGAIVIKDGTAIIITSESEPLTRFAYENITDPSLQP